MAANFPSALYPLGDSAITIEFGTKVDLAINRHVIDRFHQLQAHPLPHMLECVPAYSSLTIYFDILSFRATETEGTACQKMIRIIEEWLSDPVMEHYQTDRVLVIPVCYDEELGPDLAEVCREKKISKEELITLHTQTTYRVFMLGFIPGFPYMGELDERLSMPRKMQPQMVQAGSVGITGRQTGIYPMLSPGGWQIIGRTPLTLFSADAEIPGLFQPGDEVRFEPISRAAFERYHETSLEKTGGSS